ncbi:glycosyltransferase [uncultured Algoriphagus sp.]|uniref:glycosyltransferase n=1 Tax=uncultured Algoriphagus sp. TaxID=417365 RepID=UPI0030EBCBBE
MLSFYLIWSLSYVILLWWISRFWPKKIDSDLIDQFYPQVTLIVPFRNEADNVPDLCFNLNKLDFPNLEILLVDDHSEDASFELLEKAVGKYGNVTIVKSEGLGKKAAIETAVSIASGEFIVCTDADCDFPDLWIEKMISPFQNPKVQLVAGAVLVEERRGFLDKFQSLDWASILLMTNYSFARQVPLMCSGANLAYRKEAFKQVNGFEGNREFASGDDEFLLKKIHHAYGKEACIYLASSEILVLTRPESSWEALVNQRVRWASKWKAHDSILHLLSAVGAFLIQLIWLGSSSLIFLGRKGILTFGLVWLMKIAAEKMSLGKVLKSLAREPSMLAFVRTSFVHPFYVLRTGFGALGGKFTWKGRRNWRSVNLESEI